MQRWVAHNGESTSCTNIQESPVTPGKKVSRKAPPVTVSPTASPSVRTLILGIDRTGRIVQHDRTAPKILARSSDDLLGVNLADITATQPKDGGTPVSPDKGATLVVGGRQRRIRLRDPADPDPVGRTVHRARPDARGPAARLGPVR